MIRFEELHVRYGREQGEALGGVTLGAERGAITAVVGPNGSGKSTLVRALIGRIVPASGRILIDDRPSASLGRAEVARRVAVVTQREEPAFPLAVTEYVALGRHPHLGAWRAPGPADEEAAARALAMAGADDLRDRRVDGLSGGEWQRVRLARALAQGGEALVLDEPTTYLDVAHEMAVFELLSTLAHDRGLAVLLVSHQLNLVARYADRIVLLHRGHVVADGAAADVMRGPVLEQVYEWPLVVSRDPAVGSPMLVPLRRRVRQ